MWNCLVWAPSKGCKNSNWLFEILYYRNYTLPPLEFVSIFKINSIPRQNQINLCILDISLQRPMRGVNRSPKEQRKQFSWRHSGGDMLAIVDGVFPKGGQVFLGFFDLIIMLAFSQALQCSDWVCRVVKPSTCYTSQVPAGCPPRTPG